MEQFSGILLGMGVAPSPIRRQRLLTVDAFRAVAALMVVFHHLPIGGSGPAYAAARAVSATGFSGVSLFLVISGFSIHLRWAGPNAAKFEFKRFWIRRFIRLYPTFYAAVLITVVVSLVIGTWDGWSTPIEIGPGTLPGWATLLTEVTVVSGTVIPLKWIVLGWSIALEEHLYAAYSLLMVTVKRIRPVALIWASLSVSLVWRVSVEAITRSVPQGQFIGDDSTWLSRMFYVQAPARCFEWVLGLVLAEVFVGNIVMPRVFRRLDVGLILFVLAAAMFRWPLLIMTVRHQFYATDVVLDQTFGLSFFCLMGWGIDRETRRHSKVLLALAKLGLASYSLYLIHPVVTNALTGVLPAGGWQRGLSLLGVVVACLAAAGVLYFAVERRFISRSQAFGHRPPEAQPAHRRRPEIQ